jgi:hypothetical protein
MTTERMWAIKHTQAWVSFYYGTYCTRQNAIKEHVRQIGGTWRKAYQKGDRAVRVTVSDEVRP